MIDVTLMIYDDLVLAGDFVLFFNTSISLFYF